MREKTTFEIMIEEKQRKEFNEMFKKSIEEAKRTEAEEIEELKRELERVNKENKELKELVNDLEKDWNEQEEEIEKLKKELNIKNNTDEFYKYYVLKDLINYYQKVIVLDENINFYEASQIRIKEVLNEEKDFYVVYKVSKKQIEKIENEILNICRNFKYKQLLENIKLVENTYTHF